MKQVKQFKTDIMKKILIIQFLFIVFALIGEVKCIVKAVNCNWEPVGKAEVVYTAGAFTGLGAVIGWINIKDE